MTAPSDDQEQKTPRWVPYTPPPLDGWDRLWDILRRLSFPFVAVLFVGGIVGFFYWADQLERGRAQVSSGNVQSSPEDRSTSGLKPSADSARLSVRSSPRNAVVRLNGDSLGRTPLTDHPLDPGAYMVSIEASGHSQTDTVLVLTGDEDVRLQFALRSQTGESTQATRPTATRSSPSSPTEDVSSQPAARSAPPDQPPDSPPSSGALYVTSEPVGATVTVGGTERGRTPLTIESLEVGTAPVALTMDGYQSWDAQATVMADSTHRIHAELTQKMGRLRVLARPWGTLYINGALQARELDVWYETKLPVGTHRVRAVHPTLGTKVQTVEVRADDETSVEFDLAAEEAEEPPS